MKDLYYFRNILIVLLGFVVFSLTACGSSPVLGAGDETIAPTPAQTDILPAQEEPAPSETATEISPTETPHPTNTPVPDLGFVYFVTGGNVLATDLSDGSTDSILSLNSPVTGASLSQDFRTFAFSVNEQLFLMDVASGNTISSMQGQPGETIYPRGFNPVTSSNFIQLMIRRDDGSRNTFHTVDFARNESEQNWDFNFQDLANPPLNQHYGCDTGSAWSPDGSMILVTGLGFGLPCNINPGATLISPRRGLAYPIAEMEISNGLSDKDLIIAGARTPAWSPNGEYLYFSMDGEPTAPFQFVSRIFRVRDDGSDVTQITNNFRGTAGFPVASTNELLLYALSGDSPQTDGIYLHNISDGRSTLEVNGAGLCPLGISPENNVLLYGRSCDEQGRAVELKYKIIGEDKSTSIARSADGLPVIFLGWKK